ncbi:MAG TPA: SURF1 family cytochrome oxidase biogenesis protein [Caulobacteraceae bacterium]|nr:SURF1 family cytochrome oxidase biogenesis protein [Caulobacteraceae bacterium]
MSLGPMFNDRVRPGGPTVLGALFSLAGLIILVWLGVWQLQRMAWKEDLLKHIAALKSQAARPLAEVLAGHETEFVRVSLDCPDLMSRPRVRLYGVQDGEAGYRFMTACPIAGGAASVLVDLGFEAQGPQSATRPACLSTPSAPRLSGPVVGILREPDKATFVTPTNQPSGNLWYSRDLPAMAKALGAAPPAASYIALESTPGAASDGCPLVRSGLPSDLPNNHLSYALTWFGLAAALVGVYVAMLFRRRPD